MSNWPRVNPGDPISIRAEQWNALGEAVRRQYAQDVPGRRAPRRDDGTILIKNTSGATVPRYGVLGIDGPIIDPGDNAEGFKERVALVGVEPEEGVHDAAFVIAQEPILDGAIGRARIDGLTVATVAMGDEDDRRAVITHEDSTKLTSASGGGPLEILWVESGTGDKLALVRWAIGGELIYAEITAVANDYVTVNRIDAAGDPLGEDFYVAKPEKLRHDASYYPLVTTFTTVDQDEATVGDGSDSEDWEVRPSTYTVGDKIVIAYVGHSGVEVSSVPVAWIDINVDGRAWSAV